MAREINKHDVASIKRQEAEVMSSLADFIISHANQFHEFANALKQGILHYPEPNEMQIKEWLSFYHSQSKVEKGALYFLKQLLNETQIIPKLNEYIQQHNTDGRRPNNLGKGLFSIMSVEMSSDNHDSLDDETNILEAAFFYKIVISCLIFYKAPPYEIYSMAKDGDITALDKLLRLDKSLLYDPNITIHLYKNSCKRTPLSFEQLIDSLKQFPAVDTKKTNVKYFLASFIYELSKRNNSKIKIADIFNKFHEHAKKSGENKYRDPDLPESINSFTRNLGTNRKTWEPILKLLFDFIIRNIPN